jgi:hypothetical protein
LFEFDIEANTKSEADMFLYHNSMQQWCDTNSEQSSDKLPGHPKVGHSFAKFTCKLILRTQPAVIPTIVVPLEIHVDHPTMVLDQTNVGLVIALSSVLQVLRVDFCRAEDSKFSPFNFPGVT